MNTDISYEYFLPKFVANLAGSVFLLHTGAFPRPGPASRRLQYGKPGEGLVVWRSQTQALRKGLVASPYCDLYPLQEYCSPIRLQNALLQHTDIR